MTTKGLCFAIVQKPELFDQWPTMALKKREKPSSIPAPLSRMESNARELINVLSIKKAFEFR